MDRPLPFSRLQTFTVGPFRIGSNLGLEDFQIRQLVELFNRSSGQPTGVLGGRTAVMTDALANIGRVAVKAYRRGGLVRRVSKATYLRLGKPRSRIEYEMMVHAGNSGISTLRPVAYAYCGKLFYRNWLVTHEVVSVGTLVDVGLKEPEKAVALIPLVVEEIRRMIRQRILHIDLHPGNVLVGKNGGVFLVDFDGAGVTGLEGIALAKRYARRWQRALDKHNLPESLRLPPASALWP